MKSLPRSIERLADYFSSLPGIGPKTAYRLVFHLVHSPKEHISSFAEAINALTKDIAFCGVCRNVMSSDNTTCSICSDGKRDKSTILVVEDILDLFAFENIGTYDGTYHVLGGLISPVQGIGPDQLSIDLLTKRLKTQTEEIELIIATNPNLEGEATGMYLKKEYSHMSNIKISRLARGLPSGADLEYADFSTLDKALLGRSQY